MPVKLQNGPCLPIVMGHLTNSFPLFWFFWADSTLTSSFLTNLPSQWVLVVKRPCVYSATFIKQSSFISSFLPSFIPTEKRMDASGWKSCTDWSRTWRWRRSRSCSSVTRWSHISRTSCRRWRPRATWRASTSRSAPKWPSPRPRSAACCRRRSSKTKLRWDAFATVAVRLLCFVQKITNKVASTLGSALGLSVLKPRNAAWSWRKSSKMELGWDVLLLSLLEVCTKRHFEELLPEVHQDCHYLETEMLLGH